MCCLPVLPRIVASSKKTSEEEETKGSKRSRKLGRIYPVFLTANGVTEDDSPRLGIDPSADISFVYYPAGLGARMSTSTKGVGHSFLIGGTGLIGLIGAWLRAEMGHRNKKERKIGTLPKCYQAKLNHH